MSVVGEFFEILDIMSLIAAGIAGAAALTGALINRNSTSSTNRKNRDLAREQNEYNVALQDRQFAFDKEQSELEYQRNLEKWNMENEYNSPQAQRQRLVEAGLNPNLVYGSGTAAAGTAGTAVPYSAPRYQSPRAERATYQAPQFNVDPYQAVSIAQALALQKSQREQVDAQTDAIKQQTKNSAVDELIKAVELTGARLTVRQKEELYATTISQAKENLRKTYAETANLHHMALNIQHRNNLSEQQLYKVAQEIKTLKLDYNVQAFKYKLLKLGVTDKDNAITRFASRILLAREDEIQSLINSLFGTSSSPSRSTW